MLRWQTFRPTVQTPIYMSTCRIARRLLIPLSTVGWVCSTFLQRGYQGYCRTLTRFRMLAPDVQRLLCSERVLRQWSAFSITQRVQMLKQRDISISPATLKRFYRSHSIKPRACQLVYKRAMANNYEDKRREFAVKLGNLIAQNQKLVYVDETTFHSRMSKAKSWSLPDKINMHTVDAKRWCVTVYGAIGNCLPGPVYYFGPRTTNADDYCHFVRLVSAQVRPVSCKPYILYDNASAHTARRAQAVMNEHFEPLANVPYSCGFNCKYTHHVYQINHRV